MHQIEIAPIPFVNQLNPRSFYCNLCKAYSTNFYKSAMNTGYRRCRDCHRKRIQGRKSRMGKLDLLLRKLKTSLCNHNRKDLARMVTLEHVKSILQANCLETEDEIKRVKAIKPSFDLSDNKPNQLCFSITFERKGLNEKVGRIVPA
jgi:transposase-like protein